MRLAAWILALTFLAPGMAGAMAPAATDAAGDGQVLPPLPGGSASDADHERGSAGTPATPDGPHFRFKVGNDQRRDQRVDIEMFFRDQDEAVHRTSFVVPGGSMHTHVVELPQAYYDLAIDIETIDDGEFGGAYIKSGMGSFADSRGCDGTYVVRAGSLREDMWPRTSTRYPMSSGCLARPAVLEELLHEAEAAAAAPKHGRSVAIPAPHDQDEAVYQTWSHLTPADWEAAWDRTYRWTGRLPFVDAWGRDGAAAVLRYWDDQPGISTEFDVNGCGPLGQSHQVEVTGAPRQHSRLFEVDGVEEAAHFAAWTAGWRESMAFPPRPLECGESGFRVEAPVVYDAFPWDTACFLRSWFQGRDVREGGEWPAEALCGDLPGHGPTWVAGPVRVEDGARTVALYRVVRDGDHAAVAVVRLAEGEAYPREFRFASGGGTYADHRSHRLVAVRAAGEPLPTPGPATPPAQDLAPLRPLHGPALGQEARARFAFPLDEAAERARLTAGAASAAPVLIEPDAILSGAVLRHRREVAVNDGATVEVDSHIWNLVFTAPGKDRVFVTCERKVPVLAASERALPTETCREERPPLTAAQVLEHALVAGRADLPARAIPFDTALARWDATRPDAEPAPVRFAVYLPHLHPVPWERGVTDTWSTGSLLVGTGMPATPLMVPGPVRAEPGIGVTALAERAGVTAAHASKTTLRLEQAGLLERRRDGRAVRLRVVAKARQD